MAEYIDPPLNLDYDGTVDRAVDYLMANIDGWTPRESSLEMWLIEVASRMNVETGDLAARAPRSIFRYFGQSMLGIPAIAAARARVHTTWTLEDSRGRTIPAGTVVAFDRAADEQVYFEVETPVVIAPGVSTTAAGEVVLVALDEGTVPNGIPSGSTYTLVTAYSWVSTITSTTTSSGGVDGETESAYLARLSGELQLLTPRPIKPNEFAVLAQRIPGVSRAIAIDNYDPTSNTYTNERMVTVALADAEGEPVAVPVKEAVANYLNDMREVNFVVHIIDPNYAQIDVSAALVAKRGENPALVQEAATAALYDYLDPSNWQWPASIVRRNELISLLDQVPGVDYVDTINPPTNIFMPPPAPLPRARNITVSVS